MKLIIAGSRDLYVHSIVIDHLLDQFRIGEGPNLPENFEIVSGGASGIDTVGEMFATETNTKLIKFSADWDKHGKAAGPIRNKQMAEYADALLLIWDGESKGSANIKTEMLKLNKPIYEVILRKNNVT